MYQPNNKYTNEINKRAQIKILVLGMIKFNPANRIAIINNIIPTLNF